MILLIAINDVVSIVLFCIQTNILKIQFHLKVYILDT